MVKYYTEKEGFNYHKFLLEVEHEEGNDTLEQEVNLLIIANKLWLFNWDVDFAFNEILRSLVQLWYGCAIMQEI